MSLNSKAVKSEAGLILLSAGESSRMGKPKLLLEFQGESLLRRAALAALESKAGAVAVVLGANAEILRNELRGLDLETACNKEWKKGMGGSIKAGLEKLFEVNSQLKAVVITLGDQPFAQARVIDQLIEKYLETKALIVASRYAETMGVPALFDRKLFAELMDLSGKSGAQNLIERFRAQTVSIDFPAGAFDIDTPEDYEGLLAAGFFG